MKPTDLWGDHPHGFVGRACDYGDDCHRSNRDGSNLMRHELGKTDAADRSVVPYDLSQSIRDACETALDGDAPEPTTLGEW
jgi:hypothetical protein